MKLAFLHIPKTGGRTIINLCKQFYDEQECATVHNLRQPYEMTTKFAAGHFPYDILPPHHMRRVFTILRDPAQRVASHYQMALSYNSEQWEQYNLFWKHDVPMDILEFANDDILKSGMVKNAMVRQLVGRDLFLQDTPVQSHHVEIAIQNLQSLLVGFIDNYDSFVERLCKVMGWNKPTDYPILNQSKPYHVSNNILEEIRAINQWDIMLYDWAKENLSD